jgi:hypothetical protein
MMMLIGWLWAGMVVLFGAGFGVRAAQMKRSVSVAAREREGQQHHQASQPERLHDAQKRNPRHFNTKVTLR